jgi:hypothetical protein
MGTFGANFGANFDVPSGVTGKFGANFGANFDVETQAEAGAGWQPMAGPPRHVVLESYPRGITILEPRNLYTYGGVWRRVNTYPEAKLLKEITSEPVSKLQSIEGYTTTAKLTGEKLTNFDANLEAVDKALVNSKLGRYQENDIYKGVDWQNPRLKKLLKLALLEELENME